MIKTKILAAAAWLMLFAGPVFGATSLPNILFILVDDLGYGDLACYNPQSKIPTRNLDQLASQGMRFTDAHSPSTVCTPSRYSLMTGRMAFRTGYRGVFSGVAGPCLIELNRLTLPGMLGDHGYETAMFGKWHIGMTFYDHDGRTIEKGSLDAVQQADLSRTIPDSKDNRRGMIAPNYDLEKVDLVFLDKSQNFMREHVRSNSEKPFFLFHSMQAVHLPSFPAKQFQGKTNSGPHGDFIYEMDWIVGELLKTLNELNIADNTIVMFASDNGPEVPTVIAMRHDHQHDGARPWRGVKRDQWEGGHRTPFIVRWPGKIPAGAVCEQTVSLTDVMATCAAVVGAKLSNGAAEDSYDLLPVLLGTQGDKPVRPFLLQQTWTLQMSVRRGDWKYLAHKGSGGNDYDRDSSEMKPFAIPDTASDAPGQLYNLKTDPGETTNLYFEHPQTVFELKSILEESRRSGRSAPVRN